jgi:hypothetical protein
MPVSGQWCSEATELFNTLKAKIPGKLNESELEIRKILIFDLQDKPNENENLVMKVYACEDYRLENGRTEPIYSVDLLFGGEDSITEYLLQQNLAVKVS